MKPYKKLKSLLYNIFKKLPKRSFQIFTFINIALTVANLIFVFMQYSIAKESWKVQQNDLGFQQDIRSQDYVRKAFDDLYSNKDNADVMFKIKEGKLVNNKQSLNAVVDIFEEIGSDFCQGTAKARHIRTYLLNTLLTLCSNQEVLSQFTGKKNGTAILCTEFYPDSAFSSTLKKDNLSTCEFIDSNRFEKTENKRRFELE